jgi:hypothetical protein
VIPAAGKALEMSEAAAAVTVYEYRAEFAPFHGYSSANPLAVKTPSEKRGSFWRLGHAIRLA